MQKCRRMINGPMDGTRRDLWLYSLSPEKSDNHILVAGRGNSGAFRLKQDARESRDKWAHSVLAENDHSMKCRLIVLFIQYNYATETV
jgi:hypothetical protein